MKTETVILDPARPDVTLTSYILPGCRPAMLVLPGGGFYALASHEGDPFAIRFMAEGFNAFVLNYSIGKPKSFFPRPLTDVSAAIVHIRENAEKYCIDPDGIFVEGTSAGGYLAGAIGAMWHCDFAKSSPDMEYGANRPNGVILTYGVVSTREDIRCFCFDNLVTEECGEQAVSLERYEKEKSAAIAVLNDVSALCAASLRSEAFRVPGQPAMPPARAACAVKKIGSAVRRLGANASPKLVLTLLAAELCQ